MSGTLSLSSTIRFSMPHRPMHPRPRSTILSLATTVDARKSTNLYSILRIKESASQIEIKTAYRRLAKRFHPDVGSDGHDFMEIHEAYSTLSDPSTRAIYDRSIGDARRFVFVADNRFQTRRWETDQCW